MKKIFFFAAAIALMAAGCNKSAKSVTSTTPLSNAQAPISATQEISADISTWQTFVDPESGFSFKYPSGWQVVTGSKNFSVCLVDKAKPQSCVIGLVISKAPDERYYTGVASNEYLMRAFEKKYSAQTIKKDQQIVNGLHTLKYSVPE